MKKKKQIRELRDALDEITLSFAVTFEELGITGLFVDEAHNYKNVSIKTRFDKVLGINAKIAPVLRQTAGVLRLCNIYDEPLKENITSLFLLLTTLRQEQTKS